MVVKISPAGKMKVGLWRNSEGDKALLAWFKTGSFQYNDEKSVSELQN